MARPGLHRLPARRRALHPPGQRHPQGPAGKPRAVHHRQGGRPLRGVPLQGRPRKAGGDVRRRGPQRPALVHPVGDVLRGAGQAPDPGRPCHQGQPGAGQARRRRNFRHPALPGGRGRFQAGGIPALRHHAPDGRGADHRAGNDPRHPLFAGSLPVLQPAQSVQLQFDGTGQRGQGTHRPHGHAPQ